MIKEKKILLNCNEAIAWAALKAGVDFFSHYPGSPVNLVEPELKKLDKRFNSQIAFNDSLNEHIDKFIEVLLGKTGSRIDLMSNKTISLIDLNSQESLKSKIMSFKSILVGLDNNKALSSMSNSDLLNIRDEILGDLNKFLYLLTFK